MTWNPLRKNPLNQKPTPAPPLLTQSEDLELDIAVQRLMHVQDTIRRLTKEAKRYIEAIGNLDQADHKLSTNLSVCDLVHTSDEFRSIVENYLTITTHIGKTVQELSSLLQKTFVEPLKKLLDQFVLIAEAISKREELVTAWKTSYSRVKKLQEKKDKTANHVAKLEREKRVEEQAGKELRSLHSRLLIELPWFLEKRLEYIKPSVHALIMIQLDYYGSAMKLFVDSEQMYANLPGSIRSNDDKYQALINFEMNRIKSLTIVKDH